MTAALLGSKEKSSGGQICGNMTSGGTESILLAMKSSRDYMKAKKGIIKPEMYWLSPLSLLFVFYSIILNLLILSDFLFKLSIIPESAHSAYDKAAQYFNIKLWRVPVNKEFQADVKATRRYINRNTILVCTEEYVFLYTSYVFGSEVLIVNQNKHFWSGPSKKKENLGPSCLLRQLSQLSFMFTS